MLVAAWPRYHCRWFMLGSFLHAGPWITSPSTVNCEPWHGQSQQRSPWLKITSQPRCVHTGWNNNKLKEQAATEKIALSVRFKSAP